MDVMDFYSNGRIGSFLVDDERCVKMSSRVCERVKAGDGAGNAALERLLKGRMGVPVVINEEVPDDRMVFFEADGSTATVWLDDVVRKVD